MCSLFRLPFLHLCFDSFLHSHFDSFLHSHFLRLRHIQRTPEHPILRTSAHIAHTQHTCGPRHSHARAAVGSTAARSSAAATAAAAGPVALTEMQGRLAAALRQARQARALVKLARKQAARGGRIGFAHAVCRRSAPPTSRARSPSAAASTHARGSRARAVARTRRASARPPSPASVDAHMRCGGKPAGSQLAARRRRHGSSGHRHRPPRGTARGRGCMTSGTSDHTVSYYSSDLFALTFSYVFALITSTSAWLAGGPAAHHHTGRCVANIVGGRAFR